MTEVYPWGGKKQCRTQGSVEGHKKFNEGEKEMFIEFYKLWESIPSKGV